MRDPRNHARIAEKLARFRKFDKVVFDVPTTTSRAEVHSSTTSTGLATYQGPWGEAEAAHLLKRTLFGVRRAEVDRVSALSLSEAINELLTPIEKPDPPVNNYYNDVEEATDPEEPDDVEPGTTWVNARQKGSVTFQRHMSLKGWWLRQILQQEVSIHQKLAVFWHAILPVQFFGGDLPSVSYQYYELLFDHALGDYKTLIREMTINPGMLMYLNGFLNVKEAPDENYARELQELFTIGKGPDAGFTENDVYEAARVLTGWTVHWSGIFEGYPTRRFISDNHDTGDKQFSAFYGGREIKGRTGGGGSIETDELLDMIFDNEEVSKYICRRLYNFFVYHEIDANAEQNVIEPLAVIFRDNNYEILPVLRALLSSEHFFDTRHRGAYIKSPADHMLGLLRSMEVEVPADLAEEYEYMNTVYWVMASIGMELGDPPSVSGWQAYYQQPSFDKIWMTTDTVTKRAEIQDFAIFGLGDVVKFVSTLNNPSDPNELIKEIAFLLHGISLDQTVVDGIKSTLLTGQQTDNYWTSAWQGYSNDPSNEEYRSIVENRLRLMLRPLLQLSEFQLF